MSRVVASLLLLALAGLPAPPAAAYERTTTELDGRGACLWWGQRRLPFWINEAGSLSPGDGSEFQAIVDSAATWTEVPCSDLAFAYQGLTPRTDVGYQRSGGQNLVVWRETDCDRVVPHDDPCWDCADTGDDCCGTAHGCWEERSTVIAVTTTTYNRNTGQILDADIEFNGDGFVFTTADGPACGAGSGRSCWDQTHCDPGEICLRDACTPVDCVDMDLANTATHEMGHFLGLAHQVPAEQADHPANLAAWGHTTMYPTADPGEISKRTLADDDIQGLCDIYPAGGTTLTCLDGDYAWTPEGASDEVRVCGCGSLGEAGPVAVLLAAFGLLQRRRLRRPGARPVPGPRA